MKYNLGDSVKIISGNRHNIKKNGIISYILSYPVIFYEVRQLKKWKILGVFLQEDIEKTRIVIFEKAKNWNPENGFNSI